MTIGGVAVAFLQNGDSFLLMKRAADKRHYPNVWDGVGGGIKQGEFDEPERAVLREIGEETGIGREAIQDLTLRYIRVDRQGDGIRYHYIYFGRTTSTSFWQTDEGVLSWVKREEFLQREFSPAMRVVFEHYFSEGKDSETIYMMTTFGGVDAIAPLGTEN